MSSFDDLNLSSYNATKDLKNTYNRSDIRTIADWAAMEPARIRASDIFWTDYVNGWDNVMNFTHHFAFICGAYSAHSDDKEDRMWKFAYRLLYDMPPDYMPPSPV
jgi:hypothetical protein